MMRITARSLVVQWAAYTENLRARLLQQRANERAAEMGAIRLLARCANESVCDATAGNQCFGRRCFMSVVFIAFVAPNCMFCRRSHTCERHCQRIHSKVCTLPSSLHTETTLSSMCVVSAIRLRMQTHAVQAISAKRVYA